LDSLYCKEDLMNCTCGRIKIGSEVTENRNWNPDCPDHGTSSAWWNSNEQTEKRNQANERLRSLQKQAREAKERMHEDCWFCGNSLDSTSEKIHVDKLTASLMAWAHRECIIRYRGQKPL
jgi:hypothetical protein